MKASELRIGNLVDLGNRIAKVIEIGHLACVVVDLEETQDTIEDYERIKPILLTEEWFLNLGFHKYKGDNSDCFLGDFDTRCNRELFFWKGTYIQNIKYVHQLQNIYFALTGEELILNA